VLDKLAAGDRASAAGDLRGALFAYQDAVYAQPDYAFARVKLGRAYLALRYPALALAQAEQGLALDPGSVDALQLAEAARKPLPPVVVEPVPAAAPASGAPRVYPLAAVEQPRAAQPAAPAPAALPPPAAAEPQAVAPAPAAAAAQHYRTAVGLIQRREFKGAEAELDEAIAIDGRLAVAYAARASARFGQRRMRDAAVDYRRALELDPTMATPLYGLAECQRILGEPGAAELYDRYARSNAPDVREELRTLAAKRAQELSGL
jgi:tetratricopeptide (TPR) repeat protein